MPKESETEWKIKWRCAVVEREAIKELENNPLGVNFRVLVFLDWRDPRMKCGWENA